MGNIADNKKLGWLNYLNIGIEKMKTETGVKLARYLVWTINIKGNDAMMQEQAPEQSV